MTGNATRIPGQRFLFAPGPTHVPSAVLEAMHRQPMEHGDPRIRKLIAVCEAGLKRVLGTEAADLHMYAANGHGGWEAATENLVPPGQAILIPGTGYFSDEWAILVEATGRRLVRTPYRKGYPSDPNDVEQALRADEKREIAAVFVVHTDTATGTTVDVRAMRAAIDAASHPALLVVDVISSLGATLFEMDKLGVDVAIGASQKGLMCPPGVAFVAANQHAAALAVKNPGPRYYWDWQRRKSEDHYERFCGSLPQNLLFGLEAALELISSEGMAAVLARHASLAGAVHAAVECWSTAGALSFQCRVPEARSMSVTTIDAIPGIDTQALRTVAREHFQAAFAGGLGTQRGHSFRIAHLGDVNPTMILGCLAAVEAAMIVCGVPYGRGGAQKAAEYLAAGVRV